MYHIYVYKGVLHISYNIHITYSRRKALQAQRIGVGRFALQGAQRALEKLAARTPSKAPPQGLEGFLSRGGPLCVFHARGRTVSVTGPPSSRSPWDGLGCFIKA